MPTVQQKEIVKRLRLFSKEKACILVGLYSLRKSSTTPNPPRSGLVLLPETNTSLAWYNGVDYEWK